MYDPIVTAGCPQCGTLLYSEGEAIRSDTVNHGRNADNEDNYVRCARCGFPCNLNRDKQSRRGSKDGWGIEYSEIARPSDAVTH